MLLSTKAVVLLTNDTLFQCIIFHLSNWKWLKAENTRNTEIMGKEITEGISTILLKKKLPRSQIFVASLTFPLFSNFEIYDYHDNWLNSLLLLLQLSQLSLVKVCWYLPIVQWSPSHPGLHSHFPSLHWPCSAQWEWQERSSHVGPTQPSSHWHIPLEHTPWLPHSMVQSSVEIQRRHVRTFS